MKFVCNQCSAQYLISDDKVGPKGVRIKCQRCKNIILVKPDGASMTEASDSQGPQEAQPSETAQRPAADPSIQPEDVSKAFSQLMEGKIEDEGDDWHSQATEVFQVGDLLRPEMESLSDNQEEIDHAFSQVESTKLDPSATEEEEQLETQWYAAVNGQQLGPLELSAMESLEDLTSQTLVWHPSMEDWAALSDVPQLSQLAQRLDEQSEWSQDESTLSSLVNEEMASPSPEESDELEAAMETDDGSTGEEIPPWQRESSQELSAEALSKAPMERTPVTGTDSYFTGHFDHKSVLAGPSYLGPKKRLIPVKWLLVMVVCVCGAIAVILWLWLTPDGKNLESEREGRQAATTQTASPVSKTEKKGPAAISSGAGALPDRSKKAEPSEMVVTQPAMSPALGSASRQSTREKTSIPKQPAAKKRTKPKKKPPVLSGEPTKLSSAQVGQAMRSHIGELRSCSQQQQQRDSTVTGTMRISFVIKAAGRVDRINIKTREHRGSFVAGCISMVIKSIRFPKAKEPFNVPDLPIKLGD